MQSILHIVYPFYLSIHMHYMHYKDYIHHGLAAEKTPPPLPQGGGNHLAGWGGVGVIYIYTYIHLDSLSTKTS